MKNKYKLFFNQAVEKEWRQYVRSSEMVSWPKNMRWSKLKKDTIKNKDLQECIELEFLIAKVKAMARIMRRKGARGKHWFESALENQNKQEDAMRLNVTLGAEYRDKITGLRGICTGECRYISGCDQALLAQKVGKDGKVPDGHWLDVQRLERAGSKIITLYNAETPGCDMAAPIR